MDRTLEKSVKTGAEGARRKSLISQAKGQSAEKFIFLLVFLLSEPFLRLGYFFAIVF